MKYVETDNIDSLPGIRLKADDRFCFHCHDGLGCFKRCCNNLNLFLYPYDILQLKNCLQITSDQFLEAYVDIVLREGNFFPEVLLKMKPDKGMPCPFIADTGCRVYQFRPHACRLFRYHGLLYRQGKIRANKTRGKAFNKNRVLDSGRFTWALRFPPFSLLFDGTCYFTIYFPIGFFDI